MERHYDCEACQIKIAIFVLHVKKSSMRDTTDSYRNSVKMVTILVL